MNRLSGTVVRCEKNGHAALVVIRVGAIDLSAVLIGSFDAGGLPQAGAAVTALFKESETALCLDVAAHALSIRNRLACRITAVEDDGILARVDLDFDGRPLRSLITSDAAHDLRAAVGMAINALVKSTEVLVETGSA